MTLKNSFPSITERSKRSVVKSIQNVPKYRPPSLRRSRRNTPALKSIAVGAVRQGLIGEMESQRSKAEMAGFVLVGAGFAMFGLAHLFKLSFVQELLVGGALVASGLTAIGWGRDKRSEAARKPQ